MSDWTAGYIADIGYTFGYYQELNPLRAKLAFLKAGVAFPEFGTACELGYGQGLSTNLHAAASVTAWHGTDFNPGQAAFARELAVVSGSGAKLYDDAFSDFVNRPELPEFDYIGIHGIWSWVSDANRAVIVDFIKKKLKVGGVLYISYNTLPGWAAFAPLRHLMMEHAETIGATGHGIVSRIDGALDFTEKLLATQPLYARANPQITERIKKVKQQNRHYLAHEYFNRDWHPMHFATMVDWLEPAKLQYACSAHYLDQLDVINLTPEQKAFIDEIPDAMFRESTRDFMVNQQFRRDYWVKGVRKLNAVEQAEALRAQKVLLISHRPDISLKVSGTREVTLTESVYNPILDLLADHQARTLGQIEQDLQGSGLTFNQLKEAAVVLGGAGHLIAVQDEAVSAAAKPSTDKLNTHLIDKARGSNEIGYLGSPVSGGGIAVNRFQQLFLLALRQDKKLPGAWARLAWQTISAQGQRLVIDGKALDTPEENLAELMTRATEFATKQLPILQALQIV
jgi:SAM-dependent methyltransferase